MAGSTKDFVLATVAAGVLLAAGGVAVVRWFAAGPERPVELRVALPDPGAAAGAGAAVVDLPGSKLQTFEGKPSAVTAAWPRFRGAEFDGIVKGSVPLAETWPAGGPPVLWSVELGEGYAGPVVWNGCVYLMDYDEAAVSDALRCFSLDDGREIWRRSYRLEIKRNHGMSRTSPAVSDPHVVSMGPRCHVMCCDAKTGAFKWGIDLVREYGATEPLWYTGQCPLIDDGVAVLAPGGRALLMGVQCSDGRVLWETPNPDGWTMSHSSVVPLTFGGRRMYVYCARGGIVGVAADGPDRGAVLWRSTAWNNAVCAPIPILLSAGRLFLTAGYGAGSLILQLKSEGGAFSADVVRKIDKTEFACEQHTPILYKDRLFAVMPNDAGELKRQLACYDPAGQNAWSSGKAARFGLGPFLLADDKLLVLDEDGNLTLARASTTAWEPLAQARVLQGREAWAPMALADGRLLARDSKRMVCLDLRKR